VRAAQWKPIPGAALAAAAIAAWTHMDPTARQVVTLAILAGGCAFVLDDPAANVLAASPASLWRRRAMRLWLVLPLVSVLAVPVLVALASRTGAGPTGSSVLELATWIAVVLTAAAAWGGPAAAPCQLLFAVTAFAAPRRFALYPVPAHHVRWIAVAIAGAVALRWLSRDPQP
jgi:hypothetical protein